MAYKDPEKKRECQRKYREANPEKERERHRKYYEENREKERERKREWARKYREEHPEKARECQRKYREANREKARKWYRKYREANREKRREAKRKWRAANPEKERERLRLRKPWDDTVTRETVARLYEQQEGCCAYCSKDISEGYHMDHVVPQSRGGPSTYDNLRLACATCNLSKKDKLLSEWQEVKLCA